MLWRASLAVALRRNVAASGINGVSNWSGGGLGGWPRASLRLDKEPVLLAE